MAEIKHTPGPWNYLDFGFNEGNEVIYGRETTQRPIAEAIHWLDQSESHAQVKANARLIAAAPELLEALLALDDLRGAWSPPDDVIKAAWSKCRAAIAKATGDQS